MTVESLAEELDGEERDADVDTAVRLHNDVILALSEHVEAIIADLDLLDRGIDDDAIPAVLERLSAYVDDETLAHRVAILAAAAEQLRTTTDELPPDQAATLSEIADRLAGAQSIDELDAVLAEYEGSPDGIAEGVDLGRRILADGRDTIYSEESQTADVTVDPADPTPERRSKAVLRVAGADAFGAAKGAAMGVWVYGVGALPAATGGAVFGSSTAVAVRAWNRMVDRL